jgi:hypothetical protein
MLKINEFVSEDPKVHRIYGTMHSPTANANENHFSQIQLYGPAPHLYYTDHTLSRVLTSKLSQSTSQSSSYVDSNIRTSKDLQLNASYHSLDART